MRTLDECLELLKTTVIDDAGNEVLLMDNQYARKKLCSKDVLLFALVYMSKYLQIDGKFSMNPSHYAIVDYIETVALNPTKRVDAFLMPRQNGKSLWTLTVLPIWAGAYMHLPYVFGLSNSDTQAQQITQTIKWELGNNELLQQDFPEFCRPMRNKSISKVVAQSNNLMKQDNGWVFSMRGIESSVLGSREREHRPSILLLDDILPDVGTINAGEIERRKNALLQSVIPLSFNAPCLLVGTVIIKGDILDDIRTVHERYNKFCQDQVRTQLDNDVGVGSSKDAGREEVSANDLYLEHVEQLSDDSDVDTQDRSSVNSGNLQLEAVTKDKMIVTTQKNDVKTEKVSTTTSTTQTDITEKSNQQFSYPVEFRNQLDSDLQWVADANIECHYFKALQDDDTSLWPEMWPIEWLHSNKHSSAFQVNYQNKPMASGNGFWTDDDIRFKPMDLETVGEWKTLISVDPAITTGPKSDFTGIVVLSRDASDLHIRDALAVRQSVDELRDTLTHLIDKYDARLVIIESNQGGTLWTSAFKGLPAKVRIFRVMDKKEARWAKALDMYRLGKVWHCQSLPVLEEQMLSAGMSKNDDVIDSLSAAVNYFGNPSNKPSIQQSSYI